MDICGINNSFNSYFNLSALLFTSLLHKLHKFHTYLNFVVYSRIFYMYRSSAWRCSVKKVFLKISQNLQGKHLYRILFFNKVAGLSHFNRTPWVAASVYICIYINVTILLPEIWRSTNSVKLKFSTMVALNQRL